MNILITGGSGFIGSHLVSSLANARGEVDNIVNLDLNASNTKHATLQTIICDIRDYSQLESLEVETKFDICIHLAALCKEPGFEWEEYFETNHVGTLNTIRMCEMLNINRILFTSTMMVYKAEEVQRTEDSITAPDTAYGISKLLAEKELLAWKGKDPERELKIIRPAVVFGENENANFTRLYKTLRKGFFPFVGKSTTVKSSIYVKELVRFLLHLVDKKTNVDIYNFSFPNSNQQSIFDIVKNFKSVFGMKCITPVLPFRLLVLLSYVFEGLNSIGLRNSIHHRRIQKLYYSTDIYPRNALASGYEFMFDLKTALEDWKNSEDPNINV